jgi:hypothetical protein
LRSSGLRGTNELSFLCMRDSKRGVIRRAATFLTPRGASTRGPGRILP